MEHYAPFCETVNVCADGILSPSYGVDILSEVLRDLRLESAVFCVFELREPWAILKDPLEAASSGGQARPQEGTDIGLEILPRALRALRVSAAFDGRA